MHRVLITDPHSSDIQPLGADECAALLDVFSPWPSRIALAVSGGPDSMALAYCVKRWAQKQKTPPMLLAFVVDHALRPEAAAEATATQKNLAALGIESEILRWEHAPVVARLHDSARKARYRLLTEACRHHDIRHLLLAHQRDDQAETVLMRFAKGSGIGGLVGMAARRVRDGVHVWRPFLSIAKERLIATCAAVKIPSVTDPGNASDKFARGRLRRVMALLAEEGLTVDRLNDLAARAVGVNEALDYYMRMFLRAATRRDETGTIQIGLEHLRSAPIEIAQRALVLCLQTTHAETYAPEYDSLMRLLEVLRSDGEMPPRTLHGCLTSKNASQAIIVREPAGITDTPAIRAGETVLWDQRWRVTLDKTAGAGEWLIKPLGSLPHEVLDRLAPGLRHKVPRGRARASLPALWRGSDLTLIPSIEPGKESAKATLLTLWPPDNRSLALP